MTRAEIIELAEKVTAGIATDEEIVVYNRLFSWWERPDAGEWDASMGDRQEIEAVLRGRIWKAIDRKPAKSARIIGPIGWATIAAAFMGAIALGIVFRESRLPKPEITTRGKTGNDDVLPGGNKAMLTLADGQRIDLDSAGNGVISQQGGSQAVKSQAGQLSYLSTQSPKPSAALYNILATPRAGQFKLTLPDGTRVWLNNASRLRYPTAFGKDRRVELSGEAYFEVADDPGRPFEVAVGAPGEDRGSVRVLGTHFNIQAYQDENEVQTTLLQGAVRYTIGANQVVVRPGQEAEAGPGGSLKVISNVDTAGAIAWKNGYFHYSGADVQTVLRQLSRWYDVQVDYEGKIPDAQFVGDIQRNLPLSLVLEMLEKNQIGRFKIKDRTITVRPL